MKGGDSVYVCFEERATDECACGCVWLRTFLKCVPGLMFIPVCAAVGVIFVESFKNSVSSITLDSCGLIEHLSIGQPMFKMPTDIRRGEDTEFLSGFLK